MLLFFYSLIFRMILPFILVRLWWQGRKTPGTNARWKQRVGFVPVSPEPVLWVHAVSVGETIAAAPLVEAIKARRPDLPVMMTAMTTTGQTRARALFGDNITYAYSPYDTPGSVRRFVKRARPQALVVMETELWPNMIFHAAIMGTPVFLINARLSERSAKGYLRVESLVHALLGKLDWIAAQAAEDATRFQRLGAPPENISVTGSVKFDVRVTPEVREQAHALRQQLGADRQVWIAASTHEGEDAQVLDAHRRLLSRYPNALLILVPRHPERFNTVATLVGGRGFSLARRANDSRRAASTDSVLQASQVYLADTMGELLMLYGAADMAFVGGSLIERGGHNPLEPAAWALPIFSGPHVFNFADIFQRLDDGQALATVSGSESLSVKLAMLFADGPKRISSGNNALAVVEANRGALERVTTGILQKLEQASRDT